MNMIGAFEAKTHLSALLAQVEHGVQFIITKHGKSIAKLVPMEHNANQESRRQIIDYLKKTRKHNKLNGLSLKKLITEGRL